MANSPEMLQKMLDLLPVEGCTNIISLGLIKKNNTWLDMNSGSPININFINYIPFEGGTYLSALNNTHFYEELIDYGCPVICKHNKYIAVDFQLSGVCFDSIFHDVDTIYVFVNSSFLLGYQSTKISWNKAFKR